MMIYGILKSIQNDILGQNKEVLLFEILKIMNDLFNMIWMFSYVISCSVKGGLKRKVCFFFMYICDKNYYKCIIF